MLCRIFRRAVQTEEYVRVRVGNDWQPTPDLGLVHCRSALVAADASFDAPLRLIGEAPDGLVQIPFTSSDGRPDFIYYAEGRWDCVIIRVGDTELHIGRDKFAVDHPALNGRDKEPPCDTPAVEAATDHA